MSRVTKAEQEALQELEDDFLAEERTREKARKFFWGWLSLATSVTIAGNAAHAFLDSLPHSAVKLSVALTPPVVLLIALQSLHVLASTNTSARAKRAKRDNVFVLAVTVASLISVIATVLSWSALYEVAQSAVWTNKYLAALFPLCIDAGIGMCAVALVALRPASDADKRAHLAALNTPVVATETEPAPAPAKRAPRRAKAAPMPPMPQPEPYQETPLHPIPTREVLAPFPVPTSETDHVSEFAPPTDSVDLGDFRAKVEALRG